MPPDPKAEEAASRTLEKAWVKRRPPWTRTDTARWLNERSASVLAWLRRIDSFGAPTHSFSMGRWLQAERPDLFARAHRHLAAFGRDQTSREKINVWGVLS